MEREQITKALECCTSEVTTEFNCTECPYIGKGCNIVVMSDALALIKELTEEVESWKKECASRTTVYCELHSKCEKLTEEVENYKNVAENQQSVSMERYFEIKRLTEENEKLGIDNFDLICELSRIKENTLRNLQLELSMHFGTYKTADAIKISDLFKLMDNITDKLIDNNTEDN